MTDIIAGGVAGLLLGMAAQCFGMGDRQQVSAAIALRGRGMLRATLYAVGLGAVLTAFLGWLAVIDVDLLTVLPLHGGTLLGAAVFGAAAGLTGVTLGGALTMTGGGRFLEGVCAMAGCLAGAAVLPWIGPLTAWTQEWFQAVDQTWFRVTLDQPFLFSGGFLGQACLGAVLAALAVILGPGRRPEPAAQPEVRDMPPVSTDAQEVREETVVATLPGEEPVVVDTAVPEEAPEASPADADARNEPSDAKAEEGMEAEHASGLSPAEADGQREQEGTSAHEAEDGAEAEEAPESSSTGNDRPPEPSDASPASGQEAAAKEADTPIMQDHPELDTPPEDAGDWTEQMARLEAGAGQGTPVQEEALPVGAKAVGEPERREKQEDDEPLG
ncbi:MAG: hypothetical protein ACI4ML_05320 [Aristaeellaceae bacterium]